MKNKGFTLVEVMAVLVIMAVLITLTMPSVFNILDKRKNSEHDEIIEEIKSAAELYATQNKEVLEYIEKNGKITISYEKLAQEGLVEENQKDPLTAEKWNKTSYVEITKNGQKLEKNYIENKDNSPIPPNIVITANDQTISITEVYFENKLIENVTAIDETGNSFKTALTYSCKINSTGDYSQVNCNEIKYITGTHQRRYTINYNGSEYEAYATITMQ